MIAHGDGLGEGDYLYKLIRQFLNLKFVNGYLHNYTQILHSGSHINGAKKVEKKQVNLLFQKTKKYYLNIVKIFKRKTLLIIM